MEFNFAVGVFLFVCLFVFFLSDCFVRTLSLTGMKATRGKAKGRSPREFARLHAELSLVSLKSSGGLGDNRKPDFFDFIVNALQKNVSLTSLSLDSSVLDGPDAVLIVNRICVQNIYVRTCGNGSFPRREWKIIPSLLCSFRHLKELDLSNLVCQANSSRIWIFAKSDIC